MDFPLCHFRNINIIRKEIDGPAMHVVWRTQRGRLFQNATPEKRRNYHHRVTELNYRVDYDRI